MKALSIALAALLCVAVSQAADPAPLVSVDYAQAFAAGRSSHRLVAVAVGLDGWHWPRDYADHVLCRVPSLHVYRAGTDRVRLIEQPGFRLLGGAGIVVIDTTSGHAISVLPRRYCTPGGIEALMRLPRGTLTQRSLIWALRTHPERPQSVYGRPSPRLFAHASENNRRQCEREQQGHHTPIGYLGNAAEIAAESWPWNTNVVDGAIDCVAAWRTSPGHWRGASSPCDEFGYDMRRGRSRWFGGQEVWFATGVFRY